MPSLLSGPSSAPPGVTGDDSARTPAREQTPAGQPPGASRRLPAAAFQASYGRIPVVFTTGRREVVNHAVFDEDWVHVALAATGWRVGVRSDVTPDD